MFKIKLENTLISGNSMLMWKFCVGYYYSREKRKACRALDDSDGISLISLGGIFLATITGLLLTLLTLGYEVR